MAFPIQLQQNLEINRLNEQLKTIRSEFALGVSKIETGAFSVKRSMTDIIERMTEKINVLKKQVEYAVIPKDKALDFEAGIEVITDYASYDTLVYYNGLNKLVWQIMGINVALLSISDTPEQPLSIGSNNQGAVDILDDEEFLDQGFEKPVTEVQYQYKYYTIVQGDDLQRIAQRTTGDILAWPDIARINKISNDGIIDGTLIGKTIKIPIEKPGINNGSKNLVYEAIFEGTDQKKIEKFLYGTDIHLALKKMEIDGTGDIRTVQGIDCVIDNIIERTLTKKGGLNVLHPNYGIGRIRDNADTPYVVALEKHIRDIEQQSGADPRVNSAVVVRKEVKISNDGLRADCLINLIGGKNERVPMKVI